MTVAAVVAGAGSSVGSFYARFTGKEELLRHLEGRLWEEAAERWTAGGVGARAAGEPREAIRHTVAFLVEEEQGSGPLRRALTTGGSIPETSRRFGERLAGDLAAALSPSGEPAPDLLPRVDRGLRMVRASLAFLLAPEGETAPDGGGAVESGVLASELEAVLMALLLESGPIAQSDSVSDPGLVSPGEVTAEPPVEVELPSEPELGAEAAPAAPAPESPAEEPPVEPTPAPPPPPPGEDPDVDLFDVWAEES